jgi:hypothetical protein
MSVFAPIADAAASLTQIAPSAAVPSPASGTLPRFAGDFVRWITVGNSANVCSFARCAVRVFSGTANGIPGNDAAPWTLLELSPLPAFAAKVLLALPGGLPVQYVLLAAQATTTATDNSGRRLRRLVPAQGRCGSESASRTAWFAIRRCGRRRSVPR